MGRGSGGGVSCGAPVGALASVNASDIGLTRNVGFDPRNTFARRAVASPADHEDRLSCHVIRRERLDHPPCFTQDSGARPRACFFTKDPGASYSAGAAVAYVAQAVLGGVGYNWAGSRVHCPLHCTAMPSSMSCQLQADLAV